ncbi:DUF6850 family outer membrane beta-barrel protein [Pedobacter caeni]|nr:DUF6850 family outer membrane beta-barrel protein [Pedobacter caeni]
MIWICLAGIGTSYSSDSVKLDSLNLIKRLREYRAPLNRFTDGFYTNPAVKYHQRKLSLTEMNLNLEQNKQDRYVLQEGKGFKQAAFEANAFLKNEGKDALWGTAAYQNGKRLGQNWSENADYKTIYPYVMADTVGGDLSAETYRFSGGYALKLNHTILGISAAYRALMEYRNVDPRPKNTSSDLEIKLGASRSLNNRYELAIAGSFRKYSQESNLKFFSETGAPIVYHMAGLGVDHKLFAGNRRNAFYDGKGYGFELQFLPKDKTGFFSSLSYQQFSFSKVITDPVIIPLAEVNSNGLKADLGYLIRSKDRYYGWKASAFLTKRDGIESKFDNKGQNNYVRISSNQNYQDEQKDFRLTAVYGVQKESKLSWDLSADIGFSDEESQYLEPARSLQFSALSGGIQAELSKMLGKSLFRIGAGGRSAKNTKGQRSWPGMDAASSVYQMLETNYAYYTAGYQQLKLNAGWDYQLKNNMGLSLKSNWIHTSFDTAHQGNQFLLSAGITF